MILKKFKLCKYTKGGSYNVRLMSDNANRYSTGHFKNDPKSHYFGINNVQLKYIQYSNY